MIGSNQFRLINLAVSTFPENKSDGYSLLKIDDHLNPSFSYLLGRRVSVLGVISGKEILCEEIGRRSLTGTQVPQAHSI